VLVWKVRGKIIGTALCCVVYVGLSYIFGMLVRFRFLFQYLFRFCFSVFFHVSLGHFLLVLLHFVVLGSISSVLSQDIGWEEHLRNDLFCVEWDIKA